MLRESETLDMNPEVRPSSSSVRGTALPAVAAAAATAGRASEPQMWALIRYRALSVVGDYAARITRVHAPNLVDIELIETGAGTPVGLRNIEMVDPGKLRAGTCCLTKR